MIPLTVAIRSIGHVLHGEAERKLRFDRRTDAATRENRQGWAARMRRWAGEIHQESLNWPKVEVDAAVLGALIALAVGQAEALVDLEDALERLGQNERLARLEETNGQDFPAIVKVALGPLD